MLKNIVHNTFINIQFTAVIINYSKTLHSTLTIINKQLCILQVYISNVTNRDGPHRPRGLCVNVLLLIVYRPKDSENAGPEHTSFCSLRKQHADQHWIKSLSAHLH